MDDLDPAVAKRILGEYPELLSQWLEKVAEYARDQRHYELDRAHNPVYLDGVVRQHGWLSEGPEDCPDPKLVRGVRRSPPAIRLCRRNVPKHSLTRGRARP